MITKKNNRMEKLVKKVEEWAEHRGLDKVKSTEQMCKTIEELGELAKALIKKDMDLVKDSVGDTLVTLIVICLQQGIDIKDCLELAYNEIKDRKGKMVDGIFVKD